MFRPVLPCQTWNVAGRYGPAGRQATGRFREAMAMLRHSIIGITALCAFATAAAAQGKMNCNDLYKGALEKIYKEQTEGLEPNRIAELHRLALRAFDACSAGDEFNARAFFDEIDKWRR